MSFRRVLHSDSPQKLSAWNKWADNFSRYSVLEYKTTDTSPSKRSRTDWHSLLKAPNCYHLLSPSKNNSPIKSGVDLPRSHTGKLTGKQHRKTRIMQFAERMDRRPGTSHCDLHVQRDPAIQRDSLDSANIQSNSQEVRDIREENGKLTEPYDRMTRDPITRRLTEENEYLPQKRREKECEIESIRRHYEGTMNSSMCLEQLTSGHLALVRDQNLMQLEFYHDLQESKKNTEKSRETTSQLEGKLKILSKQKEKELDESTLTTQELKQRIARLDENSCSILEQKDKDLCQYELLATTLKSEIKEKTGGPIEIDLPNSIPFAKQKNKASSLQQQLDSERQNSQQLQEDAKLLAEKNRQLIEQLNESTAENRLLARDNDVYHEKLQTLQTQLDQNPAPQEETEKYRKTTEELVEGENHYQAQIKRLEETVEFRDATLQGEIKCIKEECDKLKDKKFAIEME